MLTLRYKFPRTDPVSSLSNPCKACGDELQGRRFCYATMDNAEAQPDAIVSKLKGQAIHDTVECRVGIAAAFQAVMTEYWVGRIEWNDGLTQRQAEFMAQHDNNIAIKCLNGQEKQRNRNWAWSKQ